MTDEKDRVAIVVDDMFFAAKINSAAEACGRKIERVKSREQLLLEVAERDFEAFDRSIDVHISSIRRKLGDDAKSPRWVQTVRSVGYRLLKPGTEIEG